MHVINYSDTAAITPLSISHIQRIEKSIRMRKDIFCKNDIVRIKQGPNSAMSRQLQKTINACYRLKTHNNKFVL